MSQHDDLKAALDAIQSGVTSVLDRQRELESKLSSMQQQTPDEVDLQPLLDETAAIRAALEGTVGAVNTAVNSADTTGSSAVPAGSTTMPETGAQESSPTPSPTESQEQTVIGEGGQPVSSPSVDASEAGNTGGSSGDDSTQQGVSE